MDTVVVYNCTIITFWQVGFIQLPQEIIPLLRLLGEAAYIQFPLELLADGGSQEVEGLHCVNRGVSD